MAPSHGDEVESIMPVMIRNKAHIQEQDQPPIFNIHGHTIFPYLEANGEDQVADRIRVASETFRYSSMKNFCLRLHLHPPSSAPQIRSSTHDFLGRQAYYFDIDACDIVPPALQVRLLPPRLSKSGRHLGYPKVQVAYNGRWRSITSFLRSYSPALKIQAANSESSSESQYSDQWRWWTALSNLPNLNPQRKVFRLLALPAEIRDVIYGYIFPSPLRPFPRAKCRQLSGTQDMAFRAAQPSTSMLRLNRQVYHGARHMVFCNTTWQISKPELLTGVFHLKRRGSLVQRLHLALSHEEFIGLFGGVGDYAGTSLLPLRTMNLRVLVLEFGPPPGIYPLGAWNGFGGGNPKLTCQRLVLDGPEPGEAAR